MAKQIKLLGAHLGATMAFGALGFHKGLSQPMSAHDAEVHQATLHAVDADQGGEFVQLYHTELVDVGATPIEDAPAADEADPKPAPEDTPADFVDRE